MTDKISLVRYDKWETVPPHLKTRTQLKKMGLRPRQNQPVAAIKTHWHWKTPDYDLYDQNECEPVRALSAARKAALEKARQESLKKRTCTECGQVEALGQHYRGKLYVRGGLCDDCRGRREHEMMLDEDRAEAAKWAKRMLDGLADGTVEAHEILILDSETTDLYGEIIDLALIDLAGETRYNRRFKPLSEIAPDAQRVHGLSAEMLAGEPVFADEYPTIRAVLNAAKLVLIYNAEFDTTCLRKTCKLHGCEPIAIEAECLMLWYAQYCGEWSNYHGSYRWQKLPGGDHTALADCRAALEVLKEMADGVE